MLYFSLTVCVFTSSSLPALEGALESSNGVTKGPSYILLFLLPALSDDQDVLLLLKPLCEGDRIGLSSSRNLLVLLFRGGSKSSDDSAGVAAEYTELLLGAARNEGAAVPGLKGCVKDREDCCRVAVGRVCASDEAFAIWTRSSLPEFIRMCGGLCLCGGDVESLSMACARKWVGCGAV